MLPYSIGFNRSRDSYPRALPSAGGLRETVRRLSSSGFREQRFTTNQKSGASVCLGVAPIERLRLNNIANPL
ncbi:hypothetical protein CLI15_15580 [Brucella abortus]|nr:hypothetical protein CLI15_15580 [Brucella abortus]PAO61057.1 hypothetical protein CJF65_15685 [Brucella melitensis]PHL02765.1 hypothetical protein BSU05_04755 [Brucella melitensis]PXF98101.1 hypothetical protein DMP33_14120 [Brucella abortus]